MSQVLYNAKKGLADFDPAAEREFEPTTNALPKDAIIVILDHPQKKQGTWARKTCDMVVTDSGIECHAPFIASCVINKPEVMLNADKAEIFHCVHGARTGKDLGIEPLKSKINEKDGSFPKFKVVGMWPIALNRQALIASASEETKAFYADMLGAKLEDLDVEFVPSIKRSTFPGAKKPYFSTKIAVVELV